MMVSIEVIMTMIVLYAHSKKFQSFEPFTYFLIGSLTLGLGLGGLYKGILYSDTFLLLTCFLGFISIGLGIIAIGLVLITFGQSEKSERRLNYSIDESNKLLNKSIDNSNTSLEKAIGRSNETLNKAIYESNETLKSAIESSNVNMRAFLQTQLKSIIDTLQRSRFNYFQNLQTIMLPRDVLKAQFFIEIATWEAVTIIRRAKILRKWAEPEDQRTLIKYHIILVKNVLKPDFIDMGVLKNRHVEHLLMASKELLEFPLMKAYEKQLIDIYSKHIGKMDERHKNFKNYVQRKIYQLRKRGLDNIFLPFNLTFTKLI